MNSLDKMEDYDRLLEKNAELERKLAEQQATIFTVRTILAGCRENASIKAVEHISNYFRDNHKELNNLLAKAKEVGST